MGLRFRRNIKIAPGVKLNLNKKSVGVTVGTRGAHYTINSKGKKTASVGIPGTGLSYSSTSGGSSKKAINTTKSNKAATPTNNHDNGKKWYQKTPWIIALLFLFFPVGLFLMWKYTNWNKYVKVGISAIFAIALVLPSSSTELEKITLSADTSHSYDRNEKVLIEYVIEPSDYILEVYDFEKTGGSIKISDDKVYFSSLFTGTFEIYAEKSGVKSNVITITIEDVEETKETSKTEEETQITTDTPLGEIKDNSQDETEVVQNKPQNEDTSNNVSENIPDSTTDNSQEVMQPSDTSISTENEDPVVYITNTGEKYHRGTCRHLQDSKIEKKLSEVINNYAPCGTCKPPTQ